MLWCIRGSNSALPPNDEALALHDRLGQLRRTLEVPSDAAIGCDAGRQGLCIACPERDRHPKLSVSPVRSEPPPVVSLLLALQAADCHTKSDSRLLCTAPGKLELCACHTQQALGRRAIDTNPSPRCSRYGRLCFKVSASPLGFATDAAADG